MAGMRRRAFIAAALCAPLAGCGLTVENGLFSECRPAAGDAAFADLLREAWDGLRPEQVWDMHVHLFGNGRGGSGIFVDPDFDRPRTPQGYVQRTFFMNGGCVGGDEAHLDEAMVARLLQLVERFPRGAKFMLLAFDFTHDERGRRQPERTTFSVPNEYAARLARSHPDRFEWIASVHPYREDAVARLEAAARDGARGIKWLPPAMGIDPSHRLCVPYYEALRRLRLPLLVHVGEERAVAGARHEALGNPLLLRHPLDHGVRVIAAHCASMGEGEDLDAARGSGKARNVECFALFSRLMAERRYEGLLFGDISATPQLNRVRYLPAIVGNAAWDGRLLNGSDYPLPGVLPLFSLKALVSEGLLPAADAARLAELREVNALAFDFVLKRRLRHRGRRLPAAVFETRPFFERA